MKFTTLIGAILTICLQAPLFAQDADFTDESQTNPETTAPANEPTLDEGPGDEGFSNPTIEPGTSKEFRSKTRVDVAYSILSTGTWVPFKHGPQIDAHWNHNLSLGIEYATGSISTDIQDVKLVSAQESLILLHAMWHFDTNSFYFKSGLGSRTMKTEVSGDYQIDGENGKLTVETKVLELAVGNRWQCERGFIYGVDWASVFIPLGKGTKSGNAANYAYARRKSVDNLIKALGEVPTFSIAKLQVGWSF